MRRSALSHILLGASFILIVFLISTISEQDFHDGNPMPENSYSAQDNMGGFLEQLFQVFEARIGELQDRVGEFQKNLSLFAGPMSIATLLLIALLLLLSKNARKAILVRTIAGFVVMGLFVYVFYSGIPESRDNYGDMIITDMGEDIGEGSLSELPEEEIAEPEIPLGISYLFSFIFVFLMLIVLYTAVRRIIIHRATSKKKTLLDVTEKALHSMKEGSDYSDAIVRCYDEMTIFIKEQAGLIRSASMTPEEFRTYLEKEGLPSSEIGQLTALFEQVRYGGMKLSSGDERQAETCLSTIAKALEKK